MYCVCTVQPHARREACSLQLALPFKIHPHVCTTCVQAKWCKWEPLWVIFVEFFNYAGAMLSEEHQRTFAYFELTNGQHLAWTRFAGWIVTCPVVLLFLVGMASLVQSPKSKPIRVVPLLVANLMMLLLGMTSASMQFYLHACSNVLYFLTSCHHYYIPTHEHLQYVLRRRLVRRVVALSRFRANPLLGQAFFWYPYMNCTQCRKEASSGSATLSR